MAGDARILPFIGVGLKKGTFNTRPPVGFVYLIHDSDGTPKLFDSNGNKIPIGGSVPSWAALREAEMRALPECATLTAYTPVKVGTTPVGTTVAAAFTGDGSIEGGAIQAAGGVKAFSGSIFQTPKTGVFALEGRCKFGTPTAPLRHFGVINGASTHDFSVTTNSAVDATKFHIRVDGASITNSSNQTVVADANWHNCRLTGDGTTLRMYIDNVFAASWPTSNLASDEPMGVFIATSGADTVMLSEYIYGFVRP